MSFIFSQEIALMVQPIIYNYIPVKGMYKKVLKGKIKMNKHLKIKLREL